MGVGPVGLDRDVALPGPFLAGLVTRVGELDSGQPALVADELGDRLERGRVFVAPDPQVVGRDAAGRLDGRGFGHDDAGTADGPASEVDAMPLGREPVALTRILTHRRDGDPVFRLTVAQ